MRLNEFGDPMEKKFPFDGVDIKSEKAKADANAYAKDWKDDKEKNYSNVRVEPNRWDFIVKRDPTTYTSKSK